jgi:pyruvate/2-oxoglutarate dehydrogenase complex dihydrolipoamide dehydrogenase (E3) component
MDVDVVVMGLGPGGEYTANKLAAAGLEVVGIDQHLVGGECPFYGCTPSKLMINATDRIGDVRRADGVAGRASIEPDFVPARTRIREEATQHWTDDSHVKRLEGVGVTIVRGHARLTGPGEVEVEGRRITARRSVVVNTGTRPAVLPIDGLAETPYWTNREVFRVEELPATLAVVGAGPIGVELAQSFARYGVQVTLLEIEDRILVTEEPEAAAFMQGVLREEGLDVRTGATIERVEHDGRFHLHLADGDVVSTDQLLVGGGRTPNLDDIGLETVGLDPEATTVPTDDRMRAGPRMHAIGDITGHGPFTHVSISHADVVIADLLGDEDGPRADHRAVCHVTFSDPEVGTVGMTEQAARDAGIDVRVAQADLDRSSRGWIQGAQGLIKLVADVDRRVLVGATVVGPGGGELLGMLSLAVHAEVPVRTFARMHFAYPTLHRAAQVALESLDL